MFVALLATRVGCHQEACMYAGGADCETRMEDLMVEEREQPKENVERI